VVAWLPDGFLVGADVSQAEAMSISGPKTDVIFRRYDIVDVSRKRAAMDKVGAFAARQVR